VAKHPYLFGSRAPFWLASVDDDVRSAPLGAVTGTLLVLAAVAGSGAERSRLVKARVFINGGARSFRHQISVSSKDASRRVMSVLAGQRPGLVDEPTSLKVPGGWQGRILPRDRGGWLTWAVEVSCLGGASATEVPGAAEAVDRAGCGLRAGETLTFEFRLQYEAEEIRTAPIYIEFSDGRTGIAS
jgi:hypothetical protein